MTGFGHVPGKNALANCKKVRSLSGRHQRRHRRSDRARLHRIHRREKGGRRPRHAPALAAALRGIEPRHARAGRRRDRPRALLDPDELLRQRHPESRRQRDDHRQPQSGRMERLQALPRQRGSDLRRDRHHGHPEDRRGEVLEEVRPARQTLQLRHRSRIRQIPALLREDGPQTQGRGRLRECDGAL